MADKNKTEREQPQHSTQPQDNRGHSSDPQSDLQDWEIEHSSDTRKAHPGKGDHFVGNAAETAEAPITNEPADQTRSHGNRPKQPMRQGKTTG